jgi:hypothetical protein
VLHLILLSLSFFGINTSVHIFRSSSEKCSTEMPKTSVSQ